MSAEEIALASMAELHEARATISHLTAELERCREAFRAITKRRPWRQQ